jgi:hypothetical protein
MAAHSATCTAAATPQVSDTNHPNRNRWSKQPLTSGEGPTTLHKQNKASLTRYGKASTPPKSFEGLRTTYTHMAAYTLTLSVQPVCASAATAAVAGSTASAHTAVALVVSDSICL